MIKLSNEETVTLQSIISVDGTSRMEVIASIKASSLKGAPGAILGRAQKAGLIKKVSRNNEIAYILIKEIGGENEEKLKVSSEEWAKCNRQMHQINKTFEKGEITFETFCIYIEGFKRYTGVGFCTNSEKTIEKFNENGLFHPFNQRNLNEFEKRTLEVDEKEINSFIKNKRKYSDKTINNRKVWGIGRAAIVLVDDITYCKECHHKRGYKGKKTFHNFNPEKKIEGNENSFGDGIEIMKKLKTLYGE